MTDSWDPSKPEHKAIAHGIEVGDGIAEMRTIHAARKALKTVGFEILLEEDLAARMSAFSGIESADIQALMLSLGTTRSRETSSRLKPFGTVSRLCAQMGLLLNHQCSPFSECRPLESSSPRGQCGVWRKSGLCPRAPMMLERA